MKKIEDYHLGTIEKPAEPSEWETFKAGLHQISFGS